VCRHLEIAESTCHRWIAHCAGMKANDTTVSPMCRDAVSDIARFEDS